MSDQQITLSQLEGHLWESANILRGPVDAADFKTYIFPLLFFKRICDVWDEEYQEIVDETGDEQLAWFPESHRFQIPEDCHWNDVRTKASNVGTALQRAMREIEKANPDTLYGVFGDAQWSNKDRLSDALLKDLIEHFSKLPFGNKNVNSDLLGDAYEYLIKKFADATNKKAGEFYTPRSVVRLMIDMLDPKEAETIYDPACGTGGMLLAAVQHVKEQHGDVKRLWGKLYGQEKNLNRCALDLLGSHANAIFSNRKYDLVSFEKVLTRQPQSGLYKAQEFLGRGTKIVNMGELFGFDTIDSSLDMKRMELTQEEVSKYQLTPDDLLFGRRSIVLEGAGKCSMIGDLQEPVIFESSILRVTVNPEIVLPQFIFEWLRSPKGTQQITRIRSFTTVAGIAGSDLKRIVVPVMPIKEQLAISDELSSMRASVGALSQRQTANRALKKTILEEVLGGWDVH